MIDPASLTIGSIAALAFSKFIDKATDEAASKLAPTVVAKIEDLRQKIWAKLRGIPVVDALNETAEKGGTIAPAQIQQLTPHLEAAMQTDPVFALAVQQIAQQINQEISIGEILGENVMNVYGGSAVQINNPNAPVIQGVSGGTINITYNSPPR